MNSFLKKMAGAIALLFCVTAVSLAQDMAILNANIATMDRDNPKAEAMLIKDGRITAVGSTKEMRNNIDATMEVLNLDGKFLMPGFIEGHGHFLMLGAVSYTHLTLPTICSV